MGRGSRCTGPPCPNGGRYLPCWRRAQRVFFNSFLCFFFRIFLRRFLTTEGKLQVLSFHTTAGSQSLVGSEQVAQVVPADPESLLQPHRAQLERLGPLCHR